MNKSSLEQFFTPYADDPKSFRRLVTTVQAIVLGGTLSILFFVTNVPLTLTLAAFIAVTLLLSLMGIAWPGQIVTPIAIAVVSTIFMLEGSGVHDSGLIGLTGSIVVAGLLLGAHGLVAFGFLAIVIFVSIAVAEVSGFFVPPVPAVTTLQEVFLVPLLFGAVIFSLRALINRLRQIAKQARENEQTQINTNQELLQLKDSLETRIFERTAELQRRAAQMETVASTARSLTTIQEPEQLLSSICRIVSEKFGFYHTGIFILDERSEYAILQAANSKGGQEMLKRGHRLRVGAIGIVGTVAGQGNPRIALDVGADAVFFNNPDLPATRSEMALPLKIGGQVVGVLDVQSEEIAAFKEEDVAVLSILADQVSVAIENARLFSQTKQALAESQIIYQQYIKQDWARFTRTLKNHTYTYDGIKATPREDAPASAPPHALNLPIRVRGLNIGNITVNPNNPLRTWSQDEINLAQAAAERAGLAVENFRLLTEAQRRAAKERTIGQITSRIGTSVNLRAIMQSAVEELGRAMPSAQITLQLNHQEEK